MSVHIDRRKQLYILKEKEHSMLLIHTRLPLENLKGFKDELIVPGSVMISFDMEVSPDTLYLVNNLAASIIYQYTVKIGTETIYDLNYAYLYNAYKDMWLSIDTRKNSIFKGI